jgi:hypothetical protein
VRPPQARDGISPAVSPRALGPPRDLSANAAAMIRGTLTISGKVVIVPPGNKNAVKRAAYTATVVITTSTGKTYQESLPPIRCQK